jgi:hypothetical protein
MVNFEESYILGSKEENRVLPIIKEFFNKDIQNYKELDMDIKNLSLKDEE